MSKESKLTNIHPGEHLRELFMDPMGITAYRLAKDIDVPITRIDKILAGKRSITPDTAMRLGRYFGMSAQYWLNAQVHYDLHEAQDAIGREIERIKPFVETPLGKKHAEMSQADAA